MADGPWVRRVMRLVETVATARGGPLMAKYQNCGCGGRYSDMSEDEARARRRLRALLREKEEKHGR